MTTITARGWPGLDDYKAPAAPSPGRSLRSYDLWLAVAFSGGKGAVVAMSGSVELGRLELADEAAIRDWCDPYGSVETHPFGLWRAYKPNCALVGWDLGQTLGELAEMWSVKRDGRYEIWPYGWGVERPDGKGYNARSPHRPPLWLRPRDAGWYARWGLPRPGPAGRWGSWDKGHLFAGNFIDLASLSYALGAGDGGRTWSPATGTLVSRAERVRDLALELDWPAGQWFGGYLDRGSLVSPASLARAFLARTGLQAPLDRFGDEGMEHWVEHLSGGWLSAEPAFIGRPTSVVPLDLRAAYGASWLLSGCWDLYRASELVARDVTDELRHLLRAPFAFLRPENWRRFGATLVEVRPHGEPWPVEVGELERAYCPLSAERSMWFPWPTVVAAAALSARVPEVVSATRLAPLGRQRVLGVEVLPGVRVGAGDDPVYRLVESRETFPVLKTVVNALTWGLPAELYQLGDHEAPGPWCFPPVAATVAAGPRLVLALLDRMVRDAGGQVVYRDTDSAYVTGISVPRVRELAHAFDDLSEGMPFSSLWRQGTRRTVLVRDRKKYITFTRAGRLLDWKESNLAGTYEPPPGRTERDGKGRWLWTKDYHELVVAKLLGLPQPAVPTHLTAPAVRRLQVKPWSGLRGRPGEWLELPSGESLLTRLRMWHRDQLDQGPERIEVTGVVWRGSPADAIRANREGRDIARVHYRASSCEACGGPVLAGRTDKAYCSDGCRVRAWRKRKEEAG